MRAVEECSASCSWYSNTPNSIVVGLSACFVPDRSVIFLTKNLLIKILLCNLRCDPFDFEQCTIVREEFVVVRVCGGNTHAVTYLGNPYDIPDFLFLELKIAVKNAKMKLLHKGSLI